MACITSEECTDNQYFVMEQEDIALLTHDVRNFKEALGKLRRTLNPEQEKESQHIVAHERLGEVLRILRNILEKYPALQSQELLLSASTLIQHLKGYAFDENKANHKQLFDLIDQLALTFSSRVSEYLMGDLDTSILVTNTVESLKTKPCNNVLEDTDERRENYSNKGKKEAIIEHLNDALLNIEQGVEFALNRAKIWAKYAKDVLTYVEKRCHLEMEYKRNLNKLAQTIRPLINEETNLPFQSIYCTALDYDTENSNSSQVTCNLLLGNKFLQPLNTRRTEHEKQRRQLKELWFQEVARMHDIAMSLRQARGFYVQCQRDADHRQTDENAQLKASEAETFFKASVLEANECHTRLFAVKNEILQKVRILIEESDHILQKVTVAYFQNQHTLCTPATVQFQVLYESSLLYEPGSQYIEAVKSLKIPPAVTVQEPFKFEKYHDITKKLIDQERKSAGSIESDDIFYGVNDKILCSDTDSITSAGSSHDADTSPSAYCRSPSNEFISEIESSSDKGAGYAGYLTNHSHSLSKAAETHAFRKLKTPSRCRECDSYVYFQGLECSECGLACHKKCLETLAIQCGHRRLPRKMTTFGVDLCQHLGETATSVPNIVCKCIDEIESRGHLIKGIYRVSGVKSKVEKLCQAFENGADLVDLTGIHPNVIANVLKLYLRQLPEPLLTFRLYHEFVRVAKDYPSNSPGDVTAAKEELKELVQKLSRQHYLTLALLMIHLKRISNDANINNMPPSNLGIVFGPTLLRTTEGSASLSNLVDTIHQTRAIELLISHADEIFNSQEVEVARESNLKMLCRRSESNTLDHSIYLLDRSKTSKCNENTHLYYPTESNPGNVSDDEVSYFMSIDGHPKWKTSPKVGRSPTPKIFKGSLKDYQGLEGMNVLSLGMRSTEGVDKHMKLRKTTSDSSKEKSFQIKSEECSSSIVLRKNGTENFNVVTSSVEEVCGTEVLKPSQKVDNVNRNKVDANTAGSSLDSDYSFESHTSSLESHRFQEVDETNEVFSESPSSWTKKLQSNENTSENMHSLGSSDSPVSLHKHSLDEIQGSEFAVDLLNHRLQRSVTRIHSSHSRAKITSACKQDMQAMVYFPALHKQSRSLETSQTCSSKLSIHQFKGSINSSNVEEQGVETLKTQSVGVKKIEEATHIKTTQQLN